MTCCNVRALASLPWALRIAKRTGAPSIPPFFFRSVFFFFLQEQRISLLIGQSAKKGPKEAKTANILAFEGQVLCKRLRASVSTARFKVNRRRRRRKQSHLQN
jgi:hypothetical protein